MQLVALKAQNHKIANLVFSALAAWKQKGQSGWQTSSTSRMTKPQCAERIFDSQFPGHDRAVAKLVCVITKN